MQKQNDEHTEMVFIVRTNSEKKSNVLTSGITSNIKGFREDDGPEDI